MKIAEFSRALALCALLDSFDTLLTMAAGEVKDEEVYMDLARRLYLAYVSSCVRLHYSTVERRLTDDDPPGPYWIDLAKKITQDVFEHMGGRVPTEETLIEQIEGRGDN